MFQLDDSSAVSDRATIRCIGRFAVITNLEALGQNRLDP
jgi:hypothetical protein